ncbi:MAG: CapA family protein [Lachnospiraceae bacterium]|nr:CapA family protein [Lachnospiraceae bacterium]
MNNFNRNKLNIVNKRVIVTILFSSLLLSLTGCLKKDTQVADMVEMEPKVITISTDRGDYQRAYEEAAEKTLNGSEEDEMTADTVEEFIYDDVNKIYSKETVSPEEVVLRFVGDVCFYDDFSLMSSYRDRGSDINNCIDASLLDLMRGADIFMLNNEFCYSDRGAPIEGKKYAFRSKPSNVSILHDMGADIVSLANNHAYDWGPDALMDSIDILNDAKVPFVGAGKDIYEAMRPVYFKVNGKVISYVSATQIERLGNPDTKEATETSPGVLRTLNSAKACQVISEAKANSDFCIMYVHWGSENTDLVEVSQRDLAQDYVNAGADLIIGDHSHCLQGIDYIDDVPVFYSMSNYWFNSKTVDTGIAEVVLSTTRDGIQDISIKSIRFIPAIQRGCRTNAVDSGESERILAYLQGISNYAEVDTSTGEIRKSDTNHNTQGGMNTSPTKKVEEPITEVIEVPEQQMAE